MEEQKKLQNASPAFAAGKLVVDQEKFYSLEPYDGSFYVYIYAQVSNAGDKAVEYKLGARGLRSIVEAIMMEPMYELPSRRLKAYTVTLEFAKTQVEKANMDVLREREEE